MLDLTSHGQDIDEAISVFFSRSIPEYCRSKVTLPMKEIITLSKTLGIDYEDFQLWLQSNV